MSTNNFNYENICVVVEDEEYYDGYVEDTGEYLSQKIKGFKTPDDAKWIQDDKRVLGFVDFYEKNNGEYYASIYVTVNYGYYADACIDYIVEYEDEDRKLQYIENKIESKTRVIEKVIKKLGKEIIKIGGFSNGEAVYRLKE